MSNTSYSLPASNFSCLHMCELSVFCSGVFLEVRTKNSEHALSSTERQDKLESTGGLLPAGVTSRKKESSAVFVQWHGMFLGAGASRF